MSQEPLPPTGEIILYSTEDGRARVECRFAAETVWLTQALMAELYQKDVRTINEHLQNLFEEEELDPEATIRKFRIVRQEGAREVTRLIGLGEQAERLPGLQRAPDPAQRRKDQQRRRRLPGWLSKHNKGRKRSLSEDDGPGACELVWVEEMQIGRDVYR